MNETYSVQIFTLLGSFFAGAATYMLLLPLIYDLFDRDHLSLAAFNRRQLRHRRLRETSTVFRIFEKWILGLSRILDRRAPILVHVSQPTSHWERSVNRFTKCLFGSPKKLHRSVQIRNLDQPWITSELMGAGILIGVLVTLSFAVCFLKSVNHSLLVILAAFVFLASYRFSIHRFHSTAIEKQREIIQLLPHAVETISMVMQAGGTFLQGIDSVIEDFPRHSLSKELLNMRTRLSRGQTMKEAIGTTAEVIRLPEFDEVARALLRIHDHGAPSSESFNRLSKQMRMAHLRRMEERIGIAESRMSLPTMLILFSCMLICLAPFLMAFSARNPLQ